MATPDYPAAIKPLVDEFHHSTNTLTRLRQQLKTGKSGAFVGLVDCVGMHDGVFVLKVDSLPTQYANEETRHRNAIARRAFRGQIPEIRASFTSQTHYVLLLRLAGGSRIEWSPLVESPKLFRSAYEGLAEVLWTPDIFSWREQAPISEVVTGILDYRLSGKHGGRIPFNIQDHLGPDLLSSVSFAHLDEVLPNPYYFASQPNGYSVPVAQILAGPLHGDCHAGNVFVRARIDAAVDSIYLIDLALYRDAAPFFFDHAYFELATLLRRLDGLGEVRWRDLNSPPRFGGM